MGKKWISDFLGIGYRYTDIHMNVLILFTDKKAAIKTWNENVHWWPDNQIVLSFVEDTDYYWFILYQQGKNLLSKDNVGFFKKNSMTQNYLRFKKNFEEKSILRFAHYKDAKKKTTKNEQKNDIDGNDTKNDTNFELNIFKSMKTIYDVKFLKSNELEKDSVEYSLIKATDTQYA